MQRMTAQRVALVVWMSAVASWTPAGSSLNCEKQTDFLTCDCLSKDFNNCSTELFADQNFSGISKFHINCHDRTLSLVDFSKLAQGIKLADLSIVRCELTDWHRTKVLPAALCNLENLTITQSFSAYVFPNFGDLFVNLQSFTFHDNYLHLNHHYINNKREYQTAYVQHFSFQFENAAVCFSRSIATEKMITSNDVKFPMYKYSRSCFCTFDNSSVQMYCFGAHILDLRRALNAIASMPQYTNPTENCTIITAINLHNLQFLLSDFTDSEFEAILNEKLPGIDIADLRGSATHPFIFQLDTCEEIGNITNATDAWKELQGLLCPMAELIAYAKQFSVLNCPHANELLLTDHSTAGNQTCGMLLWDVMSTLQYLDLSNNNITMEQYLAIFQYQIWNQGITVFNFSGNFLDILKPELFYLINPFNLHHVDLSFSHLTAVQDNPFEYLPRIQWLSLAGNDLQHVQHYWFRDLRNLKHLDLSMNQRFNGVLGLGKTYPQIWPESLEHLDLSITSLVDADDRDWLGKKNGQRFTDKFFMGLSNLLVLNLSNADPRLSAELFRPLRSLQVLDLGYNGRFIENPLTTIPNDLLKHLASLRSLYMAELLPRNNELYNAPCEFFKYTAMLRELDLTRVDFSLFAVEDQPPKCVNLLKLYSWVLWKRRGIANFTFLKASELLCTYKNTTYSFGDIEILLANFGGDFNLSFMFNEVSLSAVVIETPIQDICDSDSDSSQRTQWTQVLVPLIVCLVIIFIVVLVCIPTRLLMPTSLQRNNNSENWRNFRFELAKFEAKSFRDKRKVLREMFFQETLINGFLFAYSSKMTLEKIAWYAVILAFTGTFIYQTIGLWIQYNNTNPSAQFTMASMVTIEQQNFTVCFPVKMRNCFELTTSDVYTLAEKPMCDQNTGLSLPIRNAMLRDVILFRIGAQMAWEGATLNHDLRITEPMQAMDHIVFGRNLSYRQLLSEINGILCDVMRITMSMESLHSTINSKIVINPAGCSNLLQQQGFGLTWYDLIETNTACIRFPVVFNFSEFNEEGVLQFHTWQFFYNATSANIDFGGYEYPLAASSNSFPARAYLHHDTLMVFQLKSVFRSLETYRSKTNRCHKNCIGTKRVREIQTQCNCRPLMFADLSDPTLPDCTLDIYKTCGLSRNGDLKDCNDAIPCEFWDYAVQPTDNGLTVDNSTIIHFDPMNTLYIVYEEQDARSVINFLGDVGGVFGLWLGGSMVAITHIFFFCLKSIYLLVPGHGGRSIGYNVENSVSVCNQTESTLTSVTPSKEIPLKCANHVDCRTSVNGNECI